MVDQGNNGTSHVQRSNGPEANRIRNNLIFKLGVDIDRSSKEVNREPSRGSLLGHVQLSKEPLKYKTDEESKQQEDGSWSLTSFFLRKPPMPEAEASLGSSFSSSSVSSSPTETSQQRRLTFNEEVAICPIPMRNEYSKRVKERLWPSPEDMMLNAHRNTVEFAAEGWDWRNSMEDENMYRCVATNELIHPVHIEQQQQVQSQR